jgi:hypothetical protein
MVQLIPLKKPQFRELTSQSDAAALADRFEKARRERLT